MPLSRAGETVERFPTNHLFESEVILHHLFDNFLYGCESWVLSLDMIVMIYQQ